MLAPQTTPPPMATIIHLGAGEGDRLQEFRDRGARQIVLLEPAADAAKALEQMTADWPDARVINAVAAARDGQADLRLWNLARLNSLAPASPQLHELYPGLRQRSQQSVRLLSPRSLLAEIGDIARPLLLVIETPGSELETLEGWKAEGLIEQVDQIELHCAEEVLYEGAATRAELEAWLADEGFVVTARDRDDPDWTVLHLRADHAVRALKRAQGEIAEHLETISRQAKTLEARDAALKETSERVEALKKSLAQTRAEADARTLAARDTALKEASERTEALETSLARTKAEAEETAKALEARDAALKETSERVEALKKSLARARAEGEETSRTLEAREATLKEASERAEALEKSLARTKAELKETSERVDSLKKSLAQTRVEAEEKARTLATREAALKEATERAQALRDALGERDTALTEAQAQAEKHAARLKEQQSAHAQAHKERDKAFADLGLAMRMQGLLQSDLDDLRERYRRSEETRASQEALLRKLTPRLQDAAHQLRQLQLVAEPEASAKIAPARTAKAKSKARDTTRKRASGKKSADAG